MDKRRFLGVSVAACLMLLTPLMVGCGGGSERNKEDSLYPGSYGSLDNRYGVWLVTNGRSVDSGALSFTINKKGEAIGQVISNDGTVGVLAGKFDNNGLFHGSITRGSEVTQFSGQFARQNISVPSLTDPQGGEFELTPGLKGDFRQTLNGVEQLGTFFGIGGNIVE